VDVFLFDEPLSNLDAKLRADLRVELKRLHDRLGNTMIYVTHDQVEAMTLADRIAVMRGGAIEQLGSPDEIYNGPQTKYVADFIGSPSMNFLDGTISGGVFRAGDVAVALDRYAFRGKAAPDGRAWFGIRPEHVATGDAARGLPFTAEVPCDLVEPMGADTLVWATLAGQPFRIRMDGGARVRTGDRLAVGFDPARASVFDAGSELRV
jgi:multiple sugar transport system ATP-binding protein